MITEAHHINRGGDITYHGPGQITGYPVFDLEYWNLGLKQYIHMLEETIIRFLSLYDLKGERLEGATGVWLDPEVPGRARKICFANSKSWGAPNSIAKEVTPLSVKPQGLINEK